MSPRIGELFAGYGGLGRGVKAVLGGEVAWVSEIDKGACKVLAHRFPGVPNHGDITTIDWSAVTPVEVLTAGFPCQPVSHAGKRLGDDDERWLWDEVARAVRALRPGLLVLENVRGLLTARSGRLFGRVLGSLAELGYDAQWLGLRAADVGAPHNRWRVFIVAHPNAAGRREQRWPVAVRAEHAATQQPRDYALTLLPSPRTSDTNGAGAHGDGGVDLRTAVALLPTPAVNDMGDRPWANPETWDAWVAKHKARGINGNGHGPSLAIEAQRLLPTPMVTDWNTGASRWDDDDARLQLRDFAGVEQWGDYAAAIHRWEHTLGRPAPAPTQTSSKGNPQLAPAFVEWMMGLPAGWVTDVPSITRNEALKLCGNGVVPQQAEAALRVLLSRMAVAA